MSFTDVGTGSDLIVQAFTTLRQSFFDNSGAPIPFPLRDKRNTQDDPFDEYVHQLLNDSIPNGTCEKAPGALTTPDLVLLRPALCDGADRGELRNDLGRIVGVEVKKLERTASGRVARASGMDYNTTPPCGTLRVYDSGNQPLLIRGFYLFVCQEVVNADHNTFRLSALVLCDGNVLNQDVDLYLNVTSSRQKTIGLGTYEDGADRQRPMLIFSNPLGCKELDRSVTLIHPSDSLEQEWPQVQPVYRLVRNAKDGQHRFGCYRLTDDVESGWQAEELVDPFPSPTRKTQTQGRGRFRVSINPK